MCAQGERKETSKNKNKKQDYMQQKERTLIYLFLSF
jgi:hypothetical protein